MVLIVAALGSLMALTILVRPVWAGVLLAGAAVGDLMVFSYLFTRPTPL